MRAADSGDIDLAYLGILTIHGKIVEEYKTEATSILQVKIGAVAVQVHIGDRAIGLRLIEAFLAPKT
ncbi:MAG: hypothetical protein AAF417_07355 [Pseudomonadota bacterium]